MTVEPTRCLQSVLDGEQGSPDGCPTGEIARVNAFQGMRITLLGDSVGQLVFLGMHAIAAGAKTPVPRLKPNKNRAFDVAELNAKLEYVYAPYLEDIERELLALTLAPAEDAPHVVICNVGLHDLLYRPKLGRSELADRVEALLVTLRTVAARWAANDKTGPSWGLWFSHTPLVDAALSGPRVVSTIFRDEHIQKLNALARSTITSGEYNPLTSGLLYLDLHTLLSAESKKLASHVPDGLHFDAEVAMKIGGALVQTLAARRVKSASSQALSPKTVHPDWRPSRWLEAAHAVVVLYLYLGIALWLYAEYHALLHALSTSPSPFRALAPTWILRLLYTNQELAQLQPEGGTDKVDMPATGPKAADDAEAGTTSGENLGMPPAFNTNNAFTKVKAYLQSKGGLDLARHVLFLSLVMLYADAADGDPSIKLWPSAPRQYSRDLFAFLNVALGAAALLTIKPSWSTKGGCEADAVILNREQTEEWKGWMQVVFVLYHYFAAKETYNMIRVFIAAYVWMTGFGNFSYFYIRKDFSMVRLTKMMFRLNFLVTVVCFGLQRQYMLYYVCALHTFAFLQVYVTMYIGHASNESVAFMTGKLCALVVFNFVLFDIPGVFEVVFAPLAGLLSYNGSLHEWHFRTHLDHYMVVLGMASAYVHPQATKILGALNAQRPVVRHTTKAVLAAVCLWIGYLWFVHILVANDKYAYNAQHPYTAWLPILLFIVLRNMFTILRNWHMHLFAWLGRITLETYILQLHIWLSHDAKAVTVYIDGYPLINFVLATLLYVAASWLVFKATVALSDALVPRGAELHDVAVRIAWSAGCFAIPWITLILVV
ncbi:uncharacterized protein AMSG_01030 [Thecamonas trahens ATCC 50062]|uniref:Cas1p 10 TM acyl transferase domain-containing protein n=1 Tax=Thecamonas trahens ATCC 50062 TaxID=461836 RepID=A0A0L0DLD5_THETB|nr:hypothetical protein AMSG_01030 [Thecamonas trahens ATCC 50062]KNC52203.1 hypothetical protein AMSG_01030 [Thecamonas trahens ATCC 50062]|eukprot:XP_013762206.1 hypothetical protein AMSG_01030 [Thecamonas trahens ATCC 50062]